MANLDKILEQRYQEKIEQLKGMDIIAVAESLGMDLKQESGGIYHWLEHDSFKLYPKTNSFRWWSRELSGDTIDLVKIYRNAELYLSALRTLDRKSEQIESQLHKSTRNEELIELMELEKTIVYFKASLKTNERVIKKLTSMIIASFRSVLTLYISPLSLSQAAKGPKKDREEEPEANLAF